MRDPPSDRVPEQGPDWFLVATEGCGGGTPDLGYFLEVFVFIGIFGVGLTSGGSPSRPRDRGPRPGGRARPPTSCPPRSFLGVGSKSPGSYSGRKSRSRKVYSIWTPFDIPFLRNTEIGKKIAILR